MPLVTAPNDIEASDFSYGWAPDLEPSAVPKEGLLDAINIIPDVETGQPQVRPGFTLLAGSQIAGREIRSIHPYTKQDGTKYLILVATTGESGVGNVRVYSYNLDTEALVQINPGGVEWAPGGRHYGFVVHDTFYGGSETDPMYSWDGTTWTSNAGTPAASEVFVTDKAYREGDKVRFRLAPEDDYKHYSSMRDWKEDPWSHDGGAGVAYDKGDKVSNNSTGYWRTYVCRKKHNNKFELDGSNPDQALASEPGQGSDWRRYWKLNKMRPPLDDDAKPLKSWWREVPNAPVTNVALWHGGRMFARDDEVRTDRLIYSSQPKVEDAAIGAEWDPKDWRVTGPQGAGWQDFPVEDGQHIVALSSLGYYLLVFQYQHVHVIAGVNPETWTVRELDQVGAISRRSVALHEGLVYFLGDRGLYVTDGTAVDPVPGMDKVKDWFRGVLNQASVKDISLFSFNGFLWISLSTTKERKPDRVILYYPPTQSFWPLKLSIQEAAVVRHNDVDQLYFTTSIDTGSLAAVTTAWTTPAAAPRSTSTRSDGRTNFFKDPSFEYKIASFDDPENPHADHSFSPATWVEWPSTHSKVRKQRTTVASRRGPLGAEITNTRKDESYEGIYQSITRPLGSQYTLQAEVRRPNWKKFDAKPQVRFKIAGLQPDPQVWTDLGKGVWRVSYTGNVALSTAVEYGILVKNDRTVEIDKMMFVDGGATPYFDGDGHDATDGTLSGGDTSSVHQFATTDEETGQAVAEDNGDDIPWALRTGWFPFGLYKEVRRIRNIWALIRGQARVGIRAFTNYRDTESMAVEVMPKTDHPAQHFLGRHIESAHAISFEVSGTAAPAGILGVAAQTEPRRREGRR